MKKQSVKNVCVADGCLRKHYARGYCRKHYDQFARNGKVLSYTKYVPNKFLVNGDVTEIIITDRKGNEKARTIIDTVDFINVRKYKVSLMNNGYAQLSNKKLLHRLIMGYPKRKQIDHINGNRLDNRRENLRIVNNQRNSWNRGLKGDNTSGVTGVSFCNTKQRWMATLMVDGKKVLTKYSADKEVAIRARKEAEEMYYGEYRRR